MVTSADAPGAGRIDINRPQPGKHYSALYKIDVTLSALGVDVPATLVMTFPEAARSFRKRVVLSTTPTQFWLALNTHLFSNGPNNVEVRLEGDDGSVLTREEFLINILNDGALAERVRESLSLRDSPIVFDNVVDSKCFDTANEALLPWYDRPKALDRVKTLLDAGVVTAGEARELTSLITDGYVALDENIDRETLAEANAALDDAIAKRHQNYEYGSSQRIEHLHEHYDAIYRLWRHPPILRFLGLVFDAAPLPCQTLTYVFGSQQDLHQDTVHLTSFPPGYMCGVWIALEDIQPSSGELVVVPGSHRLKRVYRETVECAVVTDGDWSEFGEKVVGEWRRLQEHSGLTTTTYRPKAGTVLVWLDSLLHGGSVRVDRSLTRRSVVSHYFASGSIAYYDSTGLPGFTHR